MYHNVPFMYHNVFNLYSNDYQVDTKMPFLIKKSQFSKGTMLINFI